MFKLFISLISSASDSSFSHGRIAVNMSTRSRVFPPFTKNTFTPNSITEMPTINIVTKTIFTSSLNLWCKYMKGKCKICFYSNLFCNLVCKNRII